MTFIDMITVNFDVFEYLQKFLDPDSLIALYQTCKLITSYLNQIPSFPYRGPYLGWDLRMKSQVYIYDNFGQTLMNFTNEIFKCIPSFHDQQNFAFQLRAACKKFEETAKKICALSPYEKRVLLVIVRKKLFETYHLLMDLCNKTNDKHLPSTCIHMKSQEYSIFTPHSSCYSCKFNNFPIDSALCNLENFLIFCSDELSRYKILNTELSIIGLLFIINNTSMIRYAEKYLPYNKYHKDNQNPDTNIYTKWLQETSKLNDVDVPEYFVNNYTHLNSLISI